MLFFASLFGTGEQFFLEIIIAVSGSHIVTHFFNYQSRSIVIENFVNRRHGAHFHELLDHVTCLDGHALGQLGNRDSFRDFDVSYYRRSRFYKLMLPGKIVYLFFALFKFLFAVGLMAAPAFAICDNRGGLSLPGGLGTPIARVSGGKIQRLKDPDRADPGRAAAGA